MEDDVLLAFVIWMQDLSARLGREWPEELLPEAEENSEEFWREACRAEMRTRKTLSAKILGFLAGEGSPVDLLPIEAWLLRRRMEWAVQLVDAASEQSAQVDVSFDWMVNFALVSSWEEHGCQSMWLHAERGGEVPKEAAPWMRDLR